MKRLVVSLVLVVTFVSVTFAETLLTKKEISILSNQGVPNYCKVINKYVPGKKNNQPAWASVLVAKVLKERKLEDRKKEVMKLMSFVVYKNSLVYEEIEKYIEKQDENSKKNANMALGKTLLIAGMRSYLKNSIGYGTLPIYEINVANYSSKYMKIIGKIDYVKLGLLLTEELILNSSKEEFVDNLLLINSYILTYAFNTTTIVNLLQSSFILNTFNHQRVKKTFGSLYDETMQAEFMIRFYLTLLVKNANNPKINALIYHLVNGDVFSFMKKDKKVLRNYKFMKNIYLEYKKANKC